MLASLLLASVLSLATSTAFAGDETAITPNQPYPPYYVMLNKPAGCKPSDGCSSVTNGTNGRMGISFPTQGQGFTQTPVVDAKNVPLGAYVGEYTVVGHITLANGRVVPQVSGTFYSLIPEDLTGYFFRDSAETQVVAVAIAGGQTSADPEFVYDVNLGILVRAEGGNHWIEAKSNPMTIDGRLRPTLIVTDSSLHTAKR
jgi:hypothetical protein